MQAGVAQPPDRKMPENRRIAAIDIGTNSVHMIVADVKPNGKFSILGRDKDVVRLGEGVSDMKRLSPAAMERGLAAISRFALIAEQHGASVRAVAPSAVREAHNRDEFGNQVRSAAGVQVEVVDGYEEARLIYLGILQALPVYHKLTLLVDIGGGSTEFLVGRAGAVHYANSLKLGSVRLTNRFFPKGTLRPRDVQDCRAWLKGELAPVQRMIKRHEIEIAAGSSGTILNIGSMAAAAAGDRPQIDEGNRVITRKELRKVVDTVLGVSTAERRKSVPGLDPARVDIIPAGVLILEQIFETLNLKQITTSRYALREGILLDTMQKIEGRDHAAAHLGDIRRSSVTHLAESCRCETRHAAAVARYALDIFDGTRSMHMLGNPERETLEAASILHDIGYHISHSLHHQHSYYIIRHAELLGFTEGEKEIIANVARYHRKSHPRLKHENFARLDANDRKTVQALAAILRIADGLDRRHRGIFQRIECETTGSETVFRLRNIRNSDFSIEIWGAERRKQLFEEIFRTSVRFDVTESGNAR